MDIHSYIVLTEVNLKLAEAERHAELERALAKSGSARFSLRARMATLLVVLASKLSPEAVSADDEAHRYLRA